MRLYLQSGIEGENIDVCNSEAADSSNIEAVEHNRMYINITPKENEVIVKSFKTRYTRLQ